MIGLSKQDIHDLLPFGKGEGGAEWLETNGLGGWSSSTVSGCNTRRYHGLLVAATVPPAERMCLVNKLEETITVNGIHYPLSANNFGDVIYPKGYRYLSSFNKGIFPEWLYEAGGVRLKKTVAMVHGENTTLLQYQVEKADAPFTMELLPLMSVRGYHGLMRCNPSVKTIASYNNCVFNVQAYNGAPTVYIKVPGAAYAPNPCWYYNFNYSVEKARGLDYVEDLFCHGKFAVELKEGDCLNIVVSTEDCLDKDGAELLALEQRRRELLLAGQFDGSLLQMLTLSADQFIVNRSASLKTVIAGYHWFTDWGRDTMISLPGLCLSTGRVEDAKKIISAFANAVSKGMLPNRFQDNGEAPEYNNVDGTLWFFIAVYRYMQKTGDVAFVLNQILPVLKDIIDWHFKGTRYNIHVASDGLLFAGEKGQQLTWMDARIGNWVVTPRMGKPVEIEALWYNALCIFAELLEKNGQKGDAGIVRLSAARARQSFKQKFWYAKGQYLYDLVDENEKPDPSLRPNQLFALSLPFDLIEGEEARSVLRTVQDNLYTPVGLRSLAPANPKYIGTYNGSPFSRDSAYHQGTVWSWLLGPYIDAVVKYDGHRQSAQKIIQNFAFHLRDACIGSVSEIFDGNAPHNPKGCIAQAWSVAELLRVVAEYKIEG